MRKATTAHKPEREPASLPDVAIPLSEVPAHQRSAYEIALIEDPEALRGALSTDDFFPMLLNFPNAWWERLSLYLYRLTDDRGVMIRNAPGQKGYLPGGVLHHAIEEEDVARQWGGGKFRVYLKLDSKLTLREHVFYIDAPPKVLSGQVVEIQGKEVPLGTPAPTPQEESGNAVAKVIDASAKANESAMGILAHASETAIDMVKAQAVTASQPQTDPLITLKTILEIVKLNTPAAPVADPVQAKLMEKIIDRAFAKENPETEHADQTPIEKTMDTIERISGKSLPELLKPRSSGESGSEYGWVAPLANVALNFFQQLPGIIQQMNESRRLEFERQVYLRTLTPGQITQPPQAALPPQPPAQPGPQIVPAPAPVIANDVGKLINDVVQFVCTGFDKQRNTGSEIAAALDVQFGEAIEANGIDKTLSSPIDMRTFIAGVPQLMQRTQHAKWPEFEEDFLNYTTERWGEPGEEEKAEKPPAA